jgi:chromosome segregation ATPase
MDIFRAGDLSITQAEDTRRRTAEMDRMRRDMELDFNQKAAELRAEYQRDSDIFRTRQRELEREIGKWADLAVKHVSVDGEAAEARRIKEDAERKAAKIRAKSAVLNQKCEVARRKLEDLQLEHNRAKREIEKLRLSISLYEEHHE